MAGPKFREHYYEGLGGTHTYKTGTASTTAATILAAVAALRYRVKYYRCVLVVDFTTPADTPLNQAWLSDGASTPLAILASIPGLDATSVNVPSLLVDTGIITLPHNGLTGTANTALTIDFTATNTGITYALDIWTDLIT